MSAKLSSKRSRVLSDRVEPEQKPGDTNALKTDFINSDDGCFLPTRPAPRNLRTRPSGSLRTLTFLPKPAHGPIATNSSRTLQSTTLTYLPKTNAGLLEAPLRKRPGILAAIRSQTLTVLSRKFAGLLPAPKKGLVATRAFLSGSSDLVTQTFLPKVRNRLSVLSTATKAIALPKMNTTPSVFAASRWIESLENFPKHTNQIAKVQEKLPARSEISNHYLTKAKARISTLTATARSISLPRFSKISPLAFPARKWVEALDKPQKNTKVSAKESVINSSPLHMPGSRVLKKTLASGMRRDDDKGINQSLPDFSEQTTPPAESKSNYLPKAKDNTAGLTQAVRTKILPEFGARPVDTPATRKIQSAQKLQPRAELLARKNKALLSRQALNAYSLPKITARLSGLPDAVKSFTFSVRKEAWLTALADLPQYKSRLVSARKKLPDVKTLIHQLPKTEADTRTNPALTKTRLPEQQVKLQTGAEQNSERLKNIQQRNGRILDLVSLSLSIILLVLVWAGRTQLGIG